MRPGALVDLVSPGRFTKVGSASRIPVEADADPIIGVAGASNVVLAERYRARTIVTLDHRHFDVLRPLRGGRFRIPVAWLGEG